MPHDILHHYLKEHFDRAIDQLELFGKSNKQEALHQFRVSSKKIRSVFKFLRTLEHGKKIRHINRALRSIFWKAGELRDVQLRLSHLKRIRKTSLIKFYGLAEEVQNKQTLLLKNIPDYVDELKSLKVDMEKLVDDIEDRQIVTYFLKLLIELKATLLAGLPSNDWHPVRKKTKQSLYAAHWLDEKNSNRFERSALINRLDILQDEIGHWHDDELTRDWLGQKQAYLADDKKLLMEFQKVWDQLLASIAARNKNISQLMKSIGKMKIPAMV